MQGGLFGEALRVAPADPGDEVHDLAAALRARYGGRLHLGTSSWYFPGWAGLVWDAREYAQAELSKHGLAAYARHPLLNSVSLDRAFYRALEPAQYAALARQAGAGFRFVVKAAAMVSDALVRDPTDRRLQQPNPLFLDPRAAVDLCVQPAALGLREGFGALAFQLSPLPPAWLHDPAALHDRLDAMFDAVMPALPAGTLAALEVRDTPLLTPDLARLLKHHGVRYCLGLHDRLPPVDEQLPMLRAGWPGDFVCRWNLQRGLRYEQARQRWEPFDRLQAPDPATRAALARVMHGTLEAGHRVFVSINNKAEGSAPLSVIELAKALRALG